MSGNADEVSNFLVMGKSGAGKQARVDVLVREFGLEQLSTGDLFRLHLNKFDEIYFDGDLREFYSEETETFLPDEEILWKLGPVAEWEDPSGILLGLKAKYFIETGRWVPDELTHSMIETAFGKKEGRGWVLDGFPRTVAQTEHLLNLVVEWESDIDAVLLVEVDDETILDRTTGRRVCPICKEVYHVKTRPPARNNRCSHCGEVVIHRPEDREANLKARLEEFRVKTQPCIEFLEKQRIPVVTVSGNLSELTHQNVRNSVLEALAKVW